MRWNSAVESVPAWRRRLRNVGILQRDGVALAGRITDEPGTVVYADPPYVEKGAAYVHDFDLADHARLATALSRFRYARVLTSYYDNPQIRKLYAGWTILELSGRRKLAVSPKEREAAPEILLVNGPAISGG